MANYSAFTGDKEAVREKIIICAETMFAVRGIKAVRMDDIVHEINISKRTVYQIFSDKDELVIECLRRRYQKEMQLMDEVKDKCNVLERILINLFYKMRKMEQVTPIFFQDLMRYPAVVEFHKQLHNENSKKAIAYLEKGKEEGIFRDDVKFSIILELLINQLDNLPNLPAELDFREVYYSIVVVTFRGCSTLKGQTIIDNFLRRYNNGEIIIPERFLDEESHIK